MDIKNTVISGAVALVIALGVVMVFQPQDGSPGTPGTPGTPGQPGLGGSVGPDNPGITYWSVNGVANHYKFIAGRTGTNTPCAIAAPSGSSTLSHFVFHQKTATTVVTKITIAKASTFNSTTTAIGNPYIIPADRAGVVVIASTTPTGGVESESLQFKAGDYLVVGVQGGASASGANLYTPTATCAATFLGS